jgi:Protein of unknown function (DUF2934)
MTATDIAAILTGERLLMKYTGDPRPPSRDEIARLAYFFYQMRGRLDGRDIDDWLAAERELTRDYRQAKAFNRERNLDHETRHHRRHWTDRLKARDQAP